MKLYFTPTSPFVRKVLVAAHELGVVDSIETVFLRPSPLEANPELSRSNALSKIPALILDDGSVIADSRVICEYLDSLTAADRKRTLVPASGAERFRILRLQALCDGILEAGILVFYERTQRPAELHWTPWLEGQMKKAAQGLDALEREAATFGLASNEDPIDLAQICAAVAIAWLEFRQVMPDLRDHRPHLAAWYERVAARPSMQATLPPA